MADANKASKESLVTLLEQIHAGNLDALAAYINSEQEMLRKMARMRIHPSLRPRLDSSDVIQDVLVDAMDSLDSYIKDPKLPIRLWLRLLLNNRLLLLHRHHLDAQMRDVRREVPLENALLSVQSDILAENFVSKSTPPLDAVLRMERKSQIQSALEDLEPIYQEVLALRHFEQLDSNETAQVLGVSVQAASKRYYRALKQLKALLPPDYFANLFA